MAKIDLNRETLPQFIERVRAMSRTSKRRWGTMEPAQALRHLTYSIEVSLGMQHAEDVSKPLIRDVLYVFACRWFTNWPKGKLKGPKFYFPVPALEFEGEQAQLVHLLEQFVVTLEKYPDRSAVHPFFGSLTYRKWARLHGCHIDHHLRQFGV